jgi:hypothetical protein
MKKHLLNAFAVALLLIMSAMASAQPVLGTTKNFVLFSGGGAVSNSGTATLTLLTGDVGTNIGTVLSGFGNVDGVMHENDAEAHQASTDLIAARDAIIALESGTLIPHAIGLGGGESLPTGVYFMGAGAAATLGGVLTLTGTSTDKFVFIIDGALSIDGSASVVLTGQVTACNVFWQTNGQISMASGANVKGTFIAKAGPILMSGATLEGRALALSGAITVSALKATIPIGCASPNLSPTLLGPAAPTNLNSACFVLFSGNGAVTNSVVSTQFTGDIGTNLGLTTGFTNVTGTVHPTNDATTAAYLTSLTTDYDYLNLLPKDIELLYPPQFGNNLVLTPHTYLLSGATSLTGDLYLNAQGNSAARFVIQVNGAFSTASGAKIKLLNQANAENVYWKVTGAVSIEINSEFKGTIVASAAIDLKSLVDFEGRGLTTSGTITTAAAAVYMPFVCTPTAIKIIDDSNMDGAVTIYPNPSSRSATIRLNNATDVNCYELSIYNAYGKKVMTRTISGESTTLETGHLPSGIYFYKITGENKTLFKSGKLVVQK